jgi:hypothetical protein
VPPDFWHFPDLPVYLTHGPLEIIMTVNLICHPQKGLYVVNTPGSHLQRRPRVYRSRPKAMDRVAALLTISDHAKYQCPCLDSSALN